MAFRALHAHWGTVFPHLADLGCGHDWAAIWRAHQPLSPASSAGTRCTRKPRTTACTSLPTLQGHPPLRAR